MRSSSRPSCNRHKDSQTKQTEPRLAGSNNPPIARQYLQEFDAIWQASVIEEREARIARRPSASATPAAAAPRAVSCTMVWKPDVTVAAVIERSGRFLLVEERIRGRLVLNQPAGHLEDGEDCSTQWCARLSRKPPWRFTPESLLGIYHWRSPRGHTTLRFAFTGSVQDYDAQRPLIRRSSPRTGWRARRSPNARAGCARRWCCDVSRIIWPVAPATTGTHGAVL